MSEKATKAGRVSEREIERAIEGAKCSRNKRDR